MVIQSLTLQWQEAAIRGYDPNRHGLESPETERAKDIRDRLHNKDRWEQNFGEFSQKNDDSALDFERADQMASAGYWREKLDSALNDYWETSRDAHEALNSAYKQLENDRRALDLQRDDLYAHAIVLSNGKVLFVDNGELYYDNGELVTDESELLEAEAIQKAHPDKDYTSIRDLQEHQERERIFDQRKQALDTYSEKLEANDNLAEEVERRHQNGELSKEEYKEAISAIKLNEQEIINEMPEDVKKEYEAKQEAQNNTPTQGFSSYSSDMSRASYSRDDGQSVASSLSAQEPFKNAALGTTVEQAEQEIKPTKAPSPV